MDTATDYKSRFEINFHERIHLKVRNDIQIQAMEVNIDSSDIAEEEQNFFMPDETPETEEGIWKKRNKQKQNSTRRKIEN